MDEKQDLIDIVAIAKNMVVEMDNGEDVETALVKVCSFFYGHGYAYTRGMIYRTLCEKFREKDGTVNKEKMEDFFRQVAKEDSVPPGILEKKPEDHNLNPVLQKTVQQFASTGNMPVKFYRCSYCGYTVSFPFTVCPQCRKEKKSLLARIFGI